MAALIVGLTEAIVVPSSQGANAPILDPTTTTAAASGSTGGEWQTTAAGTVTASGGALSYGSITTSLNAPIVGMASTPDGQGYWLVGADGAVFAFGDTAYYGGLATRALRNPIVGMAATPDGHGYWLVGAHGSVFAFGDAVNYGGTGRQRLSAPIVGLQATADGQGYWLVASDGGVFNFGDATFYGSTGAETLTAPVVGMAATGDGSGYWLVTADGRVFNFGDAPFYGSTVGQGIGDSIVAIVPTGVDDQGYSLIGDNGASYPIEEAPTPPTSTTRATSTIPISTTPTTAPSAVVTLTPMRGAGLVDLPTDCGDMQTLGLSWYYNWESSTNCPNDGVPFVPMEFGDWCSGSSTCSALPTDLGANGNDLLTFNEPDNSSQSNMSVARAVQLWPYLEATGLQLSSPAVTSDSAGTTWLASFMSQASQLGLRVNFLALHWYGDCSNPQNLINYLAGMESSYGLPEWLTEFSCINDSSAVNANFIQQVAPQLEALPYLQRFAWFTNRPYPNGYQNTSLLDTSGVLTQVGQAYTTIPAG